VIRYPASLTPEVSAGVGDAGAEDAGVLAADAGP
jgi:hypothetical protein